MVRLRIWYILKYKDPYQALESDESAMLTGTKQESYNIFYQDDDDIEVCLSPKPHSLRSINFTPCRRNQMQIYFLG